ncbi:MAG: DUF4153 domain-containing protein [Zoogloeaceae bacterium]|jgi:hypothetical protein|nr:DUF4153 domain-containing protein [Zoogloeaceae bacterium]
MRIPSFPPRSRDAVLLAGILQGILLGALAYALAESRNDPDFLEAIPWRDYPIAYIPYTVILFTGILAPLAFYCVQDAPTRRQWRVLAAAVAIIAAIGVYQGWVIDLPVENTGSLILDALILSFAVVLAIPALAVGAVERSVYPCLAESVMKTLGVLICAGFALGFFWIVLSICLGLFDIVGLIDFRWRGFWLFALVCASAIVFAGGLLLARRETSRAESLLGFFARLGGKMFFPVAAAGIVFVLTWATSYEALQKTHRAAAILLSFVALLIFLFNLRTRCGIEEMKGKRVFHVFCWLAALVMTLGAASGLYERIGQYGLTQARIWALFVNLVALAFVTGYAASALFKSGNLAARVNLFVAGGIVAGILLMLGGILDPIRISVDSQVRRIQEITSLDDEAAWNTLKSALEELLENRAHRHGWAALEALAAPLEAPPESLAAQIARFAQLARKGGLWAIERQRQANRCQETLRVYPGEEAVPQELFRALENRISCKNKAEQIFWKTRFPNEEADSYIFLAQGYGYYNNTIWQEKEGKWEKTGKLVSLNSCEYDYALSGALIEAILAGKAASIKPAPQRVSVDAVTLDGQPAFLRCEEK